MNKWTSATLWAILLLIIALGVQSWIQQGIVYELLSSRLSAPDRIARLKEFFAGYGNLAPLIYLGFVTVEVVIAPIPGLMLYAPGGILFGPLIGGTLALAGNTLGAGIACFITRNIGDNWLSRFFDQQKLEDIQQVIERRGALFLFFLRLNPVTSSDIVSYAAGFTRIPIWKVMLATTCGMAPLCYAQAWLAEGVMSSFPWLVYPLLAACGIYLIAVCYILRKLILKPA